MVGESVLAVPRSTLWKRIRLEVWLFISSNTWRSVVPVVLSGVSSIVIPSITMGTCWRMRRECRSNASARFFWPNSVRVVRSRLGTNRTFIPFGSLLKGFFPRSSYRALFAVCSYLSLTTTLTGFLYFILHMCFLSVQACGKSVPSGMSLHVTVFPPISVGMLRAPLILFMRAGTSVKLPVYTNTPRSITFSASLSGRSDSHSCAVYHH